MYAFLQPTYSEALIGKGRRILYTGVDGVFISLSEASYSCSINWPITQNGSCSWGRNVVREIYNQVAIVMVATAGIAAA